MDEGFKLDITTEGLRTGSPNRDSSSDDCFSDTDIVNCIVSEVLSSKFSFFSLFLALLTGSKVRRIRATDRNLISDTAVKVSEELSQERE